MFIYIRASCFSRLLVENDIHAKDVFLVHSYTHGITRFSTFISTTAVCTGVCCFFACSSQMLLWRHLLILFSIKGEPITRLRTHIRVYDEKTMCLHRTRAYCAMDFVTAASTSATQKDGVRERERERDKCSWMT